MKALPDEHFLRRFVEGLEHLIADRFEACVVPLRKGIVANTENPPLNRDMELIIGRCEEVLAENPPAVPAQDDVSATSLLLGNKRR